MKSFFLMLCVTLMTQLSFSQDMKNFKLYNPYENVDSALKIVMAQAKKENKHVLLQIGGNWCSWCIMLHKFYSAEAQVDSLLKKDFVVQYINFSKENKNAKALERLEYPQRFGFPVLVILDDEGKRIHPGRLRQVRSASHFQFLHPKNGPHSQSH